MKYLIFLFLYIYLIVPKVAYTDDIVDSYLDSKLRDTDYLYINDPEDIANLSGVIYILSDIETSDKFQAFFKSYSDNLNDNFGGILLTEDNEGYFEYIRLSSCNITRFDSAMLVYEDRVKDKCYYFESPQERELYQALDLVDTAIENGAIKEEYLKEKMCQVIGSLNNDTVNTLKEDFCELFDFLINYSLK